MSGLAHLTGEADGPPIHPSYPMGDAIGGLFGALSVVTAVHSVRADPVGRGQVVDLSLTEAMFRLLDFQTIAYDQLGQSSSGTATGTSIPPHPTSIRRATASTSRFREAPTHLRANLRSIGRTDLLDDPRFATNKLRVENAREIDAVFRAWVAEHDLGDILETFGREGGTLAPIYSIDMIFEDPQYTARKAIVSVPDDTFDSVRMQGVVPRFSRSPCRVRSSAGSLGQHNDEVLPAYAADGRRAFVRPSASPETKVSVSRRVRDPRKGRAAPWRRPRPCRP